MFRLQCYLKGEIYLIICKPAYGGVERFSGAIFLAGIFTGK